MPSEQLNRLLALWTDPLADRADPEADFRTVYADPTMINGTPMSVAGLVARAAALQAALPDRQTEMLDSIETDDHLAVAFVIRATHLGTLQSPLGPVEATGRIVEARAIDLITLSDGLITHIQVVADDLGLLRQLDAVHLRVEAEPAGMGRRIGS